MSGCWKLTIVVLLAAVGTTGADDQPNAREKEARTREARELVEFVKNKSFYALRDPEEKQAIAKLQKMADVAAPIVSEMLAEGLKNRKKGWIQVYRPLYILQGMGKHGKVALPDIIAALDDKHLIVVGQAARVLGQIGPPARDAVAKIQQVWEKPEQRKGTKKLMAEAIRKIDPQLAVKLGIQ